MGIVLPFKPRAPKPALNTSGTATSRMMSRDEALAQTPQRGNLLSVMFNGRRIVHLMTQRDQPYGSERRACECCGLMMVHTRDMWTDNETEYRSLPAAQITCEEMKRLT